MVKGFNKCTPACIRVVEVNLSVVEIKVIVVVEVALDGAEVEQDVVELSQQEEARGHALAARDGVALARTAAHQLEELLRHLQVLPL